MRTLILAALAALSVSAPALAQEGYPVIEDRQPAEEAMYRICTASNPSADIITRCKDSIINTRDGKRYQLVFDGRQAQLEPLFPSCDDIFVVSSGAVQEVVFADTERWTFLFQRDAIGLATWVVNDGPESCVN